MKDGTQAVTLLQMSIVDGEISPACTTVCSSGATVRSWLATVAGGWVPRSVLSAVDMTDGLGTKRTHATATMSTSATESSGSRAAIEAAMQRVAGKGFTDGP